MTRINRLASVVAVVVSVGAVSAQGGPTTSVDLSGLGMGVLTMPQAIETDGHPATREWLVRPLFSSQARVVAERAGGLCAGPWFDISSWTVQRIGLTDWLTRLNGQLFERQPLLTPSCP